MALVVAALAGALALPALGADPPPRPTPHVPAALDGSSLAWCGDLEPTRAEPEAYRDKPVYVGNEMPAQRIRRWARTKPGFVDVWIDRERNGWVTAMFTEGAEARQAELEREFPGIGAVAVEVDNSRMELRRLAKRVGGFVE